MNKKDEKAQRIRKQMLYTIGLLVLLGLSGSWYNIYHARQEMEKELLEKALVAANSINKKHLTSLSGTPKDTLSANYLRIKSQLLSIQQDLENIEFLYIMARRPDDKIVFLVDAQPISSQNYVPPGMVYTEVSPQYLSVMNQGAATTVGPIKDRWGRFMTALVPLNISSSQFSQVTLGMDISTEYWTKWSIIRTAPIVVLILIIILLVYFMQQMRLEKSKQTASEQIELHEERYRALFENAADGILIGNQKGIIIDANHSICRLSGYSKDEMIGQNITLIFDEDELKNTPLNYQELLEGKTVRNQRLLTRKDKTRVPIEMNTRIVSDGRLQAFFRDITERKRSEAVINEKNKQLENRNEALSKINQQLTKQKEELRRAKQKAEESDRLKTAFLANMSHEIRTPMNGIIGFSEAFKEEDTTKEERARYADIVIKSGKQLLKIVNDILDISLLETGKLAIHKEPVNLNSLLMDLYTLYEKQANEKQLELYTQTSLTNNKSNILTDPYRLQQILSNLLNNAIKFTPAGQVTLGYKIKQDQVYFFVEDTGVGIEDKYHKYVFDRFWQEETNIAQQYGGTGLGLSIARKLVALLGGEIGFRSEKHKGTTFYFWLPLQYADSSSEPVKTVNIELARKYNVLIAEDEETNYLYLKEIMESCAVSILWARNGKEAVDYITQNPQIDLVLMDIKMPIMNGFQALNEIRKIQPNLAVLALTAYAMPQDKKAVLEAGFDAYLPKPVEKGDLFSIISQLT